MSELNTKVWHAIAPEIGWDEDDPEGPGIAEKALKAFTVNDFGGEKFGISFTESQPRIRQMVATLLESQHPLSFMVVQADEGRAHLWVSQRGFGYLMGNWTHPNGDSPREGE